MISESFRGPAFEEAVLIFNVDVDDSKKSELCPNTPSIFEIFCETVRFFSGDWGKKFEKSEIWLRKSIDNASKY